MSKISAAEAGRKGGRSKSPAKLEACRRNGFQKSQPALPQPEVQQPTGTTEATTQQPKDADGPR